MSERGTFVTEFIYCPECLEAVKKVFEDADQGKFFHAEQLAMNGVPQPVLSGRIGEFWPGGEPRSFEWDILPELNKVCCHPVRVVVIPEAGGPETFTVTPGIKR